MSFFFMHRCGSLFIKRFHSLSGNYLNISNKQYIQFQSPIRSKISSTPVNEVNSFKIHSLKCLYSAPTSKGFLNLFRYQYYLFCNFSLKKSKSKTKQILLKLLPYLWPNNNEHRLRVIIATSSLVISKITTIQVPFFLGQLIDTLCKFRKSIESELPSDIYPINEITSLLSSDNLMILSVLSSYTVSRLLASGFNELRNAVFSTVSNKACTTIACNTIQHLHNLDLDYLLSVKAGELSSIINRGIRSITSLLNILLFQILPTILEFVLVLSLLAVRLGFVAAALTIINMSFYLLFTTYVTKKRTVYRQAMNDAEQKASGLLLDSLINAESVRFFMNENFEKSRYKFLQKQIEKASIRVTQSLSFLNFGQQTILSVGFCCIMALTAFKVKAGIIPIGYMAFVSSLLFQLAIPLNLLGSAYRETRLNIVDLEKLHDILEVKPNCSSSSNPEPFELPMGSKIQFKNVGLTFPISSDTYSHCQDYFIKSHPTCGGIKDNQIHLPRQTVFNGLNLDIEIGKKIALVGVSGSGKSSLIKLLYRLYDPQEGCLLVNGKDLRNIDLMKFRRNIAIVPQDVVLFNDTIFFNIHYANPSASYDEVVAASKSAQLYHTIMNFPNGFNTRVGERGLRLSGGEKQRIVIARLLLRNPNIIILDEATSALDYHTELLILKELKKIQQNRTCIVIAHRLSTIVDADIIYVLGDGKLLESGNHQQLIQIPGGIYASLYESQN